MFNLLSLVFIIFSLSLPVAQASGLNFTIPMAEKVEIEGKIDVIVTVRPSSSLQSSLTNPSLPDQERKQSILGLQTAVLNQLSSTDYSNVKRFDFVPQFAITVNKTALEQLLANKNLAVSENKINYPSLLQSVQRIFPGHASSPYTGDNEWTVAVLDTGVDKDHAFLATGATKKVLSEACYSGGFSHAAVSSVCPGGVASSTASGSGVPCSVGCEHGTHVAGIAAGDGSSFDGVARLGKLIAIQVFSQITGAANCDGAPDCIGAFDSDIISGLNRVYALRNIYKIASANLSLGGGAYSGYCDTDSRKPTIDLLRNANIATVVASGNNGYNSLIGAPACISSAITIGSSLDTADTRSSFSNNGTALDLYAPGSNITSSVPGGGFATWDGTSMATPHVAGAWAIMKHAKPTATVSEIETAFKSTGVNVTSSAVTRKRINVDQALTKLLTVTPPPSPDDDFILSVMPPILAAVQGGTPPPPPVNPQWGASTELCCNGSSLTYGVTQGSQHRSSTLTSCSGTSTFNGYLTTTPGNKFFSHSVTSSTCPNLVGSGSFSLQPGKRYLWVAEYNGGNPQFVIYSGNISSSNKTASANNLSDSGSREGMVIEQSVQITLEQDAGGQSNYQGLSHRH